MYRLKTQPDNVHDKLDVGANGMLAAVKAQLVANETGLVVVLEKEAVVETFEYDNRVHGRTGWVPEMVFFSDGTPSKTFRPEAV